MTSDGLTEGVGGDEILERLSVASAWTKHVDAEVTTGNHVLSSQHHCFHYVRYIIDGLRWSTRRSVETTNSNGWMKAATSNRNPQELNTRRSNITTQERTRQVIKTVDGKTTIMALLRPVQTVASKMSLCFSD